MIRNIKYLALMPLFAVLLSCVSEEENLDVIFEEDLDKIETYIQNFPDEYMKKEEIEGTGILRKW